MPIGDPDFYNVRGAVGVLCQDMSSRLFTNVREKHGLCYSVYASYESFKDRAAIVGYAGARPELAQETLDRTLEEFRNLANGIEDDELDRVKVGLKSSLIMRQESTSARAGVAGVGLVLPRPGAAARRDPGGDRRADGRGDSGLPAATPGEGLHRRDVRARGSSPLVTAVP